jgi:hypothetical protein
LRGTQAQRGGNFSDASVAAFSFQRKFLAAFLASPSNRTRYNAHGTGFLGLGTVIAIYPARTIWSAA